jgi:potassium-dependent mechanosensitive channel
MTMTLSLQPFRARTIAILALVLGLFAPVFSAQAQSNASAAAATAAASPVEAARLALDRMEATLKNEHLSTDELVDLAATSVPVRELLQKRIAELAPRATQAEARLKQLGPESAGDAPPEPEALTAERAKLTKTFAALDAELKQARLMAVRADQLTQNIIERRYTAYARELFTRGWSILDPRFWLTVAASVIDDGRRVAGLLMTWGRFIAEEGSALRVAGALATLLIVVVVVVSIVRRWNLWVRAQHPSSRFGKAMRSLMALVRTAALAPLLVLIGVEILRIFGLLPPQFSEIAHGLVAATALGGFGYGVARGLLAPYEPERRILSMGDRTARLLAGHLTAAALLIALFNFLNVVQKAIYSPPVLIAFASMIFALANAAILLSLLFRLRASANDTGEQSASGRAWIRGIAWLLTAAIVVAVFAGYARLADFLTERLLASIVILGAFYLLAVASDALFRDVFAADTPRVRAVAANLGLRPSRLGLIGALLSGVVRVLLVFLALVVIAGPWEGTTTDVVGALQGFSFGFTIGEATISFRAVLVAVAVLIVGIFLTRAAQRWLETQVLPRTEIEPSLQLSVGVIFGYIGIIAAIALALGALGIDLQKIALVAGALSVGIGFGLQSIVSNFVSGLILLTERPIRVGDWIVAKGEEGYVRRIRVRATEVETFDRASVIIPNSDLISGVVKNWTHGNIIGRVTVKVGVSYDSDAEKVREILLAVAAEHPAVLKMPAPYVLFTGFGDSALDFELRCIISDIQQRLGVHSDLNFAVLARFRMAGIEIPFPQRVVHFAGGEVPAPAGNG